MTFPMARTWTVAFYIAGGLASIDWLITTLTAGAQGDLEQVLINLFLSTFQIFVGSLLYLIPVWVAIALVVLMGKAAIKVTNLISS